MVPATPLTTIDASVQEAKPRAADLLQYSSLVNRFESEAIHGDDSIQFL